MSMNIRSAFGLAAAAGLAISSGAFGQCAQCPAGGIQEGEAPLNNPDNYNGGCNSAPPAYGTILAGQTICGTCFTIENALRDTDWFHFNVTTAGTYTWNVTANFDAQCFILNDDCSNIQLLGQAAGPACTPLSASASLTPGSYVVFVSPSGFAGVPTDQPWVGTLVGQAAAPTGACCLPAGCCSILSSANCTGQGGIYHGDNSTCAQANCPGGGGFTMVTNIPGTFTDISGTGTDITNGDDSVGPFTSSVTNSLVNIANLQACTNGMITDSGLASFTNGTIPVAGVSVGLYPFWDDLYVDPATGGSLKHQASGGVEIVQWNNTALFGLDHNITGDFQVKIFPAGTGPGGALVQFIYSDVAYAGTGHENGASATIGYQRNTPCPVSGQFSNNQANAVQNGTVISILGSAAPSSCYANCDHSTTVPFLNVLDFNCFLNEFSAGHTYANCDNSTTPPVLNVLDFNCFLNRFSAGCSAP
jgi:hypothetical protein